MDYIPRSEAELRDWATQLSANLTSALQSININPQETQRAQQLLTDIVTSCDDCQIKEQAWRQAAAEKERIHEEAKTELRLFFNHLKTCKGYTLGTGKKLNIVYRRGREIDTDTMKPNPKISVTADGIKIKYTKSVATGVRVFCRRANETNFEMITMHDTNEYVDARPNVNNSAAEKRDYYLVYFRQGENLGQKSDIVTVTV